MRYKKDKKETLLLRLTSNQKKLLKYEAEKLNITMSELTRRQLINGLIPQHHAKKEN